MLLLVIAGRARSAHAASGGGSRNSAAMRGLDVRAIRLHRREVRPRQEAALGPRMLVADAVVVGVEEDAERRIERREAARESLEQERLEEPASCARDAT